jgi:5-methylcytosine-specific restriction enzyme A
LNRDATQKLYHTKQWEGLKRQVKAEEPLCRMCKDRGIVRATYAVDHIIPHKGDMALFWDRGNLQGLCKTCHNVVKQIQEKHGYSQGCDKQGLPLDAGHPWNKR